MLVSSSSDVWLSHQFVQYFSTKQYQYWLGQSLVVSSSQVALF